MVDFRSRKKDLLFGEVEYVHHFPNGYGASITRSFLSTDLWDVVILKKDGETWEVTFDIQIDDLTYLNEKKVNELLEKIKNL
jgi:hypothetical protein